MEEHPKVSWYEKHGNATSIQNTPLKKFVEGM